MSLHYRKHETLPTLTTVSTRLPKRMLTIGYFYLLELSESFKMLLVESIPEAEVILTTFATFQKKK